MPLKLAKNAWEIKAQIDAGTCGLHDAIIQYSNRVLQCKQDPCRMTAESNFETVLFHHQTPAPLYAPRQKVFYKVPLYSPLQGGWDFNSDHPERLPHIWSRTFLGDK